MDRNIAFCGLNCTECPAFLATFRDDNEERARVAELWSVEYNTKLEAKDINCDGCRSENMRLIGYCNICKVRNCARERGVETCADCEDYVCEKLEPILKAAPAARENLEKLR